MATTIARISGMMLHPRMTAVLKRMLHLLILLEDQLVKTHLPGGAAHMTINAVRKMATALVTGRAKMG